MERASGHPLYGRGAWHGQSCIQDHHAGLSGNSLSPKPHAKVLASRVDRTAVPCSAVWAQHPPSTSTTCAMGHLLSVGPQYLRLAQQEMLPLQLPERRL